jgi:hypothetical protein
MKTKEKFLLLVFLVVGILFLRNNFAQAQEKQSNFSITPFFQEITLEKDQNEASFSVEIKNNTDRSAVFKLSVLDFGALDESGGVAFLGSAEDLKNKYSLASWVSLEKDGLVVNPAESQAVRVTIQNKESLSPGGHYAAVLAKLEDEKSWQENSPEVAFNQSLAALIFVRKTGGEIFGLDLKSQEINKGIFNLPQKIQLRFQNTGNVHVTPRGLVKITDPFGREVMQGIINSESSLVLPETFRVFPVPLENITLAFLPGRYNLSVEYRYDGKEDFTSSSSSFFFVPPSFIFSVLVLIVLGATSYFYKKRKLQSSKE